MERTGKTFVILSNDGHNNQNEFVTWTQEDGGYYTTVEWLDEVGELDFLDSVDDALVRADQIYSSTLGGWNWAPLTISELLNFDEAYNNGADPEFKEIVIITHVKATN